MNSGCAKAKIRLRSSEGWNTEAEAGQGLDAEQPPHFERRLDTPRFAQGSSSPQGVDRFQRANLAALKLAHRVVEDFEGPRPFQPDQVAAHLTNGARRRLVVSHARPPSPGRRAPASQKANERRTTTAPAGAVEGGISRAVVVLPGGGAVQWPPAI